CKNCKRVAHCQLRDRNSVCWPHGEHAISLEQPDGYKREEQKLFFCLRRFYSLSANRHANGCMRMESTTVHCIDDGAARGPCAARLYPDPSRTRESIPRLFHGCRTALHHGGDSAAHSR